MQVFFDEAQMRHNPPTFLVAGTPRPCPEKPERAARLSAAVRAAGHDVHAPPNVGIAPAACVHTPEYLEFLKVAHEQWLAIDGASDVVIPNIHPRERDGRYPASIVARAGYHMMDTACPIGAHTYEAVIASLSAAVAATDHVMETGDPAYALCRPPGHHAYSEASGGFCFVNNSAVAAQRLRTAHERVVVIDVDLHHGNGTQGIFYERADVMTVSVHCDPIKFYPFFWGHADERGAGPGLGYNLNIPLPRGSGDDVFLAALESALERVAAFAPGAMVVALGLDASEQDPFGGLTVTTDGFRRIGAALGAFSKAHGLASVLVQEGGYLCDALGDNLVATLAGYEGA
ncbi:MAG: histone deacetylase family protein [Alphaproteobacteria bacterium]